MVQQAKLDMTFSTKYLAKLNPASCRKCFQFPLYHFNKLKKSACRINCVYYPVIIVVPCRILVQNAKENEYTTFKPATHTAFSIHIYVIIG